MARVGLLVLLLAVYSLARSVSQSDEVARALTFAVLVLANLGLIFANRHWNSASLLARSGSNRSFVWIALAAVALLACVLGVPAIGRLFAFAMPSAAMLLAGAGTAGLSLLWFEAVKWVLGRRPGSAT